jgi:hypothetical protein
MHECRTRAQNRDSPATIIVLISLGRLDAVGEDQQTVRSCFTTSWRWSYEAMCASPAYRGGAWHHRLIRLASEH